MNPTEQSSVNTVERTEQQLSQLNMNENNTQPLGAKDGEAVDQPVPPPSASGHKEGLNTITQEQAKETHAAGQKSSLASGPEAAAGGGWGQPSTHGDVAVGWGSATVTTKDETAATRTETFGWGTQASVSTPQVVEPVSTGGTGPGAQPVEPVSAGGGWGAPSAVGPSTPQVVAPVSTSGSGGWGTQASAGQSTPQVAEQVSTSGGGGWGAPAANVNVESNTSGGWGQPAPVSSQSYAPPPAADSSGYASVAEQDRLVEEQPFSRRPRGQNDYQKKEFQFTRASDDYQQQQQYNRGSPRQQQQYDYQTTRRQPPEDYRRPREEQFGGGSYGYQQQEQSYDRQPPRGAAQEHYGQQRYGQERGAYSRQERESRDNYAQDNYDRGGYQQQQQRDNRKYGGDSYGGQYNRDEGYGGQPKYNREDDYGQQRGGYQQQRQRHDDYQQQESYGGDNRRGGYDSAYESRGPQGGMSGYGGPAAGGMSGYGESYDSNAPAREPPRESIRPDEDLPSVNRSAAKRSGKYTEERDAELEGDLFGRQMLTGIRFAEYGKIPVKVQGERVPRPINEFVEAQLHPHMVENIRLAKYKEPTPVQKHGIPAILQGRDLISVAQTGSGKTGAFLIPTISQIVKHDLVSRMTPDYRRASPLMLIMTPTRELACQIFDECRKFAYRTGIRPCVVYGGVDARPQLDDLSRGCNILVATPGRLKDFIERGRISLEQVQFLVLDEADRMLDMGFEPEIRDIIEQKGMKKSGRQTLMFSATFPTEIQAMARDFLEPDYIFLTIGQVGAAATGIQQQILQVDGREKRDTLVRLLEEGGRQRVLIFVTRKRDADALDDFLYRRGFPVTSIHGDRTQVQRENALESFKSAKTPILVATDVASRGLDIPQVNHVINFDLPKNIDDYVHRIGRTARAGNEGKATAFFSSQDEALSGALVSLLQKSQQPVPPFLTESSSGFGGYNGGGGGYNDYQQQGY